MSDIMSYWSQGLSGVKKGLLCSAFNNSGMFSRDIPDQDSDYYKLCSIYKWLSLKLISYIRKLVQFVGTFSS